MWKMMNNRERLELERLDIKVDIRRHNAMADILLELDDNSVLKSAASRRKKKVLELVHISEQMLAFFRSSY